MSRISFRKNGEEHSFWQNYTDLLAGFLIVFIIASIWTYGRYRTYVDTFTTDGSKVTIIDIIVNARLYKQISEFQQAQKAITRDYFRYNNEYNRFECTVDVRFAPESPVIPSESVPELKKAGKEIQQIINEFKKSANVKFKVVIEGRAAKSHDNPNPNDSTKAYAAKLSYERARNLYQLWKAEGILSSIEDEGNEVFIAGSGFEGIGRYEGYGPEGEDRNKTFIIQIIPYLTKK